MFLPGEISQVQRSKPYAKLSIVTTNCEKSAEVIVPPISGKDRTIVVFETERR